MPDFVYKGIPTEKDGLIIVKPVRSINADDGNTYHGVLDIDARGNRFVYNQVPNDMKEPWKALIDGNTQAVVDSEGRQVMVKG